MTQWAGRGGRRGRRPLPRPCLPPSTSLRTRFVFVFVLLNQCLKEKTIIFEDRIWANYLPELCTLKCTILHKLTDHNISTFLIQGVFFTGPAQGCINCGIHVFGIRACGVSSEHMENMEMFSCSPT